MRTGIGFSDNSDALQAGVEAAREALDQVGQFRPCDLVLLFHAGRHNPNLLQESVAQVVGPKARIVGGAGMGVVGDDHFGRGGNEVGVAAIWLDGAECEVFSDPAPDMGEEAGRRLGSQLAKRSLTPASPLILFYDTGERIGMAVRQRIFNATPLLHGLTDSLGFVPGLYGAGLLGEGICHNGPHWIQDGINQHQVLTLAFSGKVRMDSLFLNGCRPATGYYSITRAAGRDILEIEGRPAAQFIDSLLDSSFPMDLWPAFLMLGVNRENRWEDFREQSYSCHICQAVDKSRGVVTMLEPCLETGDRVQVMYHCLDASGIAAQVDAFLAGVEGHKPYLALYIACAFRIAARNRDGGEDARIIQNRLKGKVPLLGLYGGGEIVPIGNRIFPVNWAGILCLFSGSK